MRRNYKRNIEIAFVISLIFAILLTRWTREKKEEHQPMLLGYNPFEVVEMPLFEEEPPPPPPIEETKLFEQIEVNDIEIIEDEEEDEEPAPQIDFDLKIEEDRVLDSQIEQDMNTKIDNYRQWKLGSSKLAFSDNYRSHTLESSGLELNTKSMDELASSRGSTEKIEISLGKSETDMPFEKEEKTGHSASIIEQTDEVDVVILKPPKSSLALTEYRMWSKLSGELDRIDKRNFNNNIPNLKKNREGIWVSFVYRDGIQHQINWKKGGKTSIKVIGKNRKSAMEELQRALSALLQLSINY